MARYKQIKQSLAGFAGNNLGQSLVELLLAIGIASAVLPAVITGFVSSREGKVTQDLRLRAVGYLKEAEEATRVVREKGWESFAINGTYYPVISGSTWSLISGVESISDFTRSIIISDINPIDPSVKLINITVSWGIGSTKEVSSKFYLTRYLENDVYTETTATQFNAGTLTNTVVTNNSGGEIQLGSGGKGDWCKPNLSYSEFDLPKSGVANAISAINGRVFAGTGDNASGVSFANISVDDNDPPNISTLGTYDGYKTNDVFGEENYAYLATDTTAKEVEIINLTTNPYSESGWFNAPGSTNASSVFVSGNVGLVSTGSNLYTFDLTSKSGSRNQLDSIALSGVGNSIFVVGNYAYVATSGSSSELQIIDVSNSSDINIVGQVNIDSGAGRDVYVNSVGTRAYLATSESGNQKELFIIDITNKNSPSILGSYDTNGMSPKGITIVPGNRAIIVGTGGYEYQVVNITNDNPVVCPNSEGQLNIDSGVNGVSSVIYGEKAYSYIITGDASSELKIIEGGPGGGSSANNGTFESQIFDAGHPVSFNRFSATTIIPSGTSITYQVAVSDPVSGLCSNAVFNFIDSTGPIYLAGQCFKYKALLLSEDSTTTPILESININYSP